MSAWARVAVATMSASPAIHAAGAGQAAAAGELAREGRGHLVAVLLAQGGGAEPEQPAIGAHQALRTATPLAMAIRTSACSRSVSARATASPNGVMR